jgi:hypothetical protein
LSVVRIGVDTSGKFTTNQGGFKSTAMVAAVGTDGAFQEIAAWTHSALSRWGIADRFSELRAKKLRAHEKLEVCQMLAERGDVRLAAVVTDPGLLGSSATVKRHRERQVEKAMTISPQTADGEQRQEELLALLQDVLQDDDYLLAACLPLVLVEVTKRAFAFFAADAHRVDMARLIVRIDEETAPTVRYGGGALLPTLGGDERFRFTTPLHWRDDPVHPLLARTRHPDGDGYWPQLLFDDVDWVSSASEPAVQVADVAAWILARRVNEPTEQATADCFDMLAPLMVGGGGRRFELFSIPPVREDQASMYAHLRQGVQPDWWLQPVISSRS